jgi:solute carrier family 25 citrate transporter 1
MFNSKTIQRHSFFLPSVYAEEKKEQQPASKTQHDQGIKIPYKRLFAGAVAGIADVWACHGLDRIKTHMQQHGGKTMYGSAKEIMQKGGIFALYEGILPMTFEAIVKVGLRYFSFSYFQEQWKMRVQGTTDPNVHVSVWGNLFGGLFAGTIESVLVVIPCELLKVRHMTQASHASFFSVLRDVVREEGFTGLYKGGTSTLLRQITNHMIRFPVFYALTSYLKEARNEKNLPATINLFAGAFAGSVSTLINTPLDTIKTRQQKHGQKETTAEIIRGIYREGGILKFWAGVIPRMVRVAPGQAITWAVYEKVIEIIGKD